MRKSSQRTKQIRSLLIFGIILTLTLILIVTTVGHQDFNAFHKIMMEPISAMQHGVTRIVDAGKGVWSNYIALIGVREENSRLRGELLRSEAVINEYREAAATNIRLTKLLEMKESLLPPTLTAQVIGKDPSQWFKTIIINRGSSDGVRKGMPVVTAEGVVGQVKNTSPDYSKVLLANDPNSAIDVLVQGNRVQGIIKGNGKGGFSLHYVLKNYDINNGDRIITSGIGGVFPKGLSAGTVVSAVKGKRGMFQHIEVQPDVDFSKIEYLIVIMKENPFSE